ncbi:MAG TPA: hypothetical protein PKE69_15715 [Pyrinomonadaceae bacterium]|nr:hypothetical protein [Pyrinomonadaceae bacterium]
MSKTDFQNFVAKTLEEVIQLAEKESGKSLSRKIAFRWFVQKEEPIWQNITQHITDKVYVDEVSIYPCVDIGVGDILKDGTLIIFANIAGYDPKPWGTNWQGNEGSFIHIIGQTFLYKVGKKEKS